MAAAAALGNVISENAIDRISCFLGLPWSVGTTYDADANDIAIIADVEDYVGMTSGHYLNSVLYKGSLERMFILRPLYRI